MDLFEKLAQKQCRTPFPRSEEMEFFLANSGMLADIPSFSSFSKATRPFDIIRANILIRALINKSFIESVFVEKRKEEKKLGIESSEDSIRSFVFEKMADLPYLEEQGTKIYVPFFTRSINKIYSGDFFQFEERSYKKMLTHFNSLLIDPFDVYGPAIYNSFFTKLVLIGSNDGEMAFYNYDSYEVYIVNEEGRLESSIPLFDRYLKRKSTNHMVDRLLPCVKAYFDNDKECFIKELVQNKLISSTFMYSNMRDEHKLFSKSEQGK